MTLVHEAKESKYEATINELKESQASALTMSETTIKSLRDQILLLESSLLASKDNTARLSTALETMEAKNNKLKADMKLLKSYAKTKKLESDRKVVETSSSLIDDDDIGMNSPLPTARKDKGFMSESLHTPSSSELPSIAEINDTVVTVSETETTPGLVATPKIKVGIVSSKEESLPLPRVLEAASEEIGTAPLEVPSLVKHRFLCIEQKYYDPVLHSYRQLSIATVPLRF